MGKIIIGTRGSKLALWQAEYVAQKLVANGLDAEIKKIETKGDQLLDVSISKIGGKGVFTEELEEKLRNGKIDIAVHSAKDLPSRLPNDLKIVAFTEREKVNDVLLSLKKGLTLDDGNIIIGTSSTRRVATLAHYYKNIKTVSVRGNLQTRIKKMEDEQCDALILAYAGVYRMGFKNLIVQELPTEIFTPAVGQGSLAIETSVSLDSEVVVKVREALNHVPTENLLLAERAYLRELEGGCSIPAFALANYLSGNMIKLDAGIFSLDGQMLVKKTVQFLEENVEEQGKKLAKDVLGSGGKEILEEIRSKL